MSPPRWVDYKGRPCPTTPCPRCGTEAGVTCYPVEALRMIGWPLFSVVTWVSWCGHQQDGIPVPTPDGEECWLVPVIGEAA